VRLAVCVAAKLLVTMAISAKMVKERKSIYISPF